MIHKKKMTKQHFNSLVHRGKIIHIKEEKKDQLYGWSVLYLSQKLYAHFCLFIYVSTTNLFRFQVVREDKKKVISFASELKKLTSRSRSMTTGGGVDGPAQSKDDRAACCVALTELQE